MKTKLLLIKQAYNNIFKNKARSLLTMLGIAIAVFVVVAVDSISNGLAQSTLDRFSDLDATRITLSSQTVLSSDDQDQAQQQQDSPRNSIRQALGGGAQVPEGSESLTDQDLQSVKNIENVTYASPLLSIETQLEIGDSQSQRLTINGVNQQYAELDELEFASGNFFSEAQVSGAEKVVVLDFDLATSLFDSAQKSVGQTIELADNNYKIVGVLAEEDQNLTGFGGGRGGPGPQRATAYSPYTTLMKTEDLEKFASLVFEVQNEKQVEPAAEAALNAVYQNHEVDDQNADVTISTAQEALSTISGITESQSKSDKFIGWIVLLVGGIGIMNIMLVTVSERTREIGLRKALGAKQIDIVWQFLSESIILTVLGGTFGLIAAVLASSQVTNIFEIRAGGPGRGAGETVAVIDANTIFIALAASILAGLIFGFWPALKASRKDPVESLRYE